MPFTRFIADLHLDPTRPALIELAARTVSDCQQDCDALYILGDLFEYWIGDDQPLHGLAPLLDAFQTLKAADVPVFFLPGNRDFLLGEAFATAHGIARLGDSAVIDLYGEATLVLHGDTLCTDDLRYQQLRQMLRDPDWQRQFLALPLDERIRQAQALREQSEAETSNKAMAIMDVNSKAVETAMRNAGVRRLIHGHTHRPAIHPLQLDGEPAQRIVLGDWYRHGSVLDCDEHGCKLRTITP